MRARVKEFRQAADRDMAALSSWERQFAHVVGEKYVGCTFDAFDVRNPQGAAKKAAVEICRKVAGSVKEIVSRGQNVILMGPVGTGKDHLLACMLRPLMSNGGSCRRINGSDLAGQCRDLLDGKSTERDFLDQWAALDLLALSDPDGNREKQSDFYGDWLYRIVDARYRANKPVWATINATDEQDAKQKVGVRAWDRLVHRAVLVETYWPSFRRPAVKVNGKGSK